MVNMGHMEKQETEMKQKLEMETGNENWKQKWEQKMHQSLSLVPRPPSFSIIHGNERARSSTSMYYTERKSKN